MAARKLKPPPRGSYGRWFSANWRAEAQHIKELLSDPDRYLDTETESVVCVLNCSTFWHDCEEESSCGLRVYNT